MEVELSRKSIHLRLIKHLAGVTFGAKAIPNWYLEPIAEGTCVRVKERIKGCIVHLMKKKIKTLVKKDIKV
jgi:hypothetical protein